jgi:hypothetical protein
MAHLQSNGQVKRANRLILGGLKLRLVKSLDKADGKWIDELPSVLWSLRTTPNRSTGYTAFFMVYGVQVILPSDIAHDSPQVTHYNETDAELER